MYKNRALTQGNSQILCKDLCGNFIKLDKYGLHHLTFIIGFNLKKKTLQFENIQLHLIFFFLLLPNVLAKLQSLSLVDEWQEGGPRSH